MTSGDAPFVTSHFAARSRQGSIALTSLILRSRSDWPLVAAGVLLLAALALFWPGVVTYDGVAQYGQALSGGYDDWHPPAMARLWSLLLAFGPGAAPMLVLQLATYWLGLGLLSGALARTGRGRAAAAVLAIGLFPPFLGWQAVVLKDAQLVGAMAAAVGILAWWRLAGRRMPRAAWLIVAALLTYATLIRANAVFVTVPLLVSLLPWRWPARGATGVLGILAVLLLLPTISHRVFDAAPTGVERTEAIYDLAGIAVRIPDATDTGLSPADLRTIATRHCVIAFFWDPLGDPAHCNAAVESLRRISVGRLYATLAGAIVRHPIAYAEHRLAHLNATGRWLVPARRIGAAPPAKSERNTLGLREPGAAGAAWQRIAEGAVETPLAWPIVWLVVALGGLAALARSPATPTVVLARALLVSAVTLEASFGVLSIASDLRYHLWPMLATALAVVLAWREGARRTLIVAGIALALVVAAGIGARLVLPTPPATYADMLG